MRKAGDVCFSQVFRERGGKWIMMYFGVRFVFKKWFMQGGLKCTDTFTQPLD